MNDATNDEAGAERPRLSRPLYGEAATMALPNIRDFDISTFKKPDIALITELNNKIIAALDYDEIGSVIVDAMTESLGYMVGCFFYIDYEKGIAYPYAQTGKYIDKFERLYGKRLKDHKADIYENQNENLVLKSIFTKKNYIGDDIRDFVSPILSYKRAATIQKLFRMRQYICLPLVAKGEVIGVALFVSNSNNVPDRRQKQLLQIFSDQISIAINNSQLFNKNLLQIERLNQINNDLHILIKANEDYGQVLKGYIEKIQSINTDKKIAENIRAALENIDYYRTTLSSVKGRLLERL